MKGRDPMTTAQEFQRQLAALKDQATRLADQADQQPATYLLVRELVEAAEALLDGIVDERIIMAIDGLSAVLEDDLAKPKPDIIDSATQQVPTA
jgi:septation ring formation regulator EzrA